MDNSHLSFQQMFIEPLPIYIYRMLGTVLILEIHQGTKETKLLSLLGIAFWELETGSKPSKLESILESEDKNK